MFCSFLKNFLFKITEWCQDRPLVSSWAQFIALSRHGHAGASGFFPRPQGGPVCKDVRLIPGWNLPACLRPTFKTGIWRWIECKKKWCRDESHELLLSSLRFTLSQSLLYVCWIVFWVTIHTLFWFCFDVCVCLCVDHFSSNCRLWPEW